MRTIALGVITSLVLFVSSVCAQTSDNSQGTTGGSPTAAQSNSPPGQTGSSTGQAGSSGSGQSGSMSNDSMHQDKGMMKGEKTLKGCIQSQNGSYMLEEHGGKMVNLSGNPDVSSHVGHTVKVHGSYAGADNAVAGTSTKSFNVASVDMVSDTCSATGKMGKKDKMGNPGNASSPQ